MVGPADFRTSPGIRDSAERVAADPAASLYCFDAERGEAVFVECATPEEVLRAPFLYEAQARLAQWLIRMPFAEFHRLADCFAPPEGRLIWIHSVGRCGSTLVSKALDTLPHVRSLSEPDDLTQIVLLRSEKALPDTELAALIESSVRWRCRPAQDAATRFAIKTRSEVTSIAGFLTQLYPRAKHVFLYRDGTSWANSVFKSRWLDADLTAPIDPGDLRKGWARMIPLVAERIAAGAPLNPVEVRTLGWISAMESYFVMRDAAVDLCAARFEDLTADPIGTLNALFRFCDLDGADWGLIREVLGRDSQAGTVFDREERARVARSLSSEELAPVERLVAERPRLRTPSVVLPGTLAPSGSSGSTV
ncbi:MAG: sulfotransferase [Fimbriimonadaceae bacterium]